MQTKEDVRAYDREWHVKHPGMGRVYKNRYRRQNQDKIAAYRDSTPHRRKWSSIKQRSKLKGMPVLLTEREFFDWYENAEKKCSYCDLTDLTLDRVLPCRRTTKNFTIDRRDASLPYSLDNIGLSCWTCNLVKRDVFPHDVFYRLAQLFIKPIWLAKLEGIRAA